MPPRRPKHYPCGMATENTPPSLPCQQGPKLTTIFLLLGLIGLAFLFSNQFFPKPCNEIFSKISDRFICHWSRDLIKLQKQKPEFWKNIYQFTLIPGNRESQRWAKNIASKIRIPRNPKGEFQIEAILIYWREGVSVGATLQYSVIDIKSKNTVFETGTTYNLGKIKKSKKKPD